MPAANETHSESYSHAPYNAVAGPSSLPTARKPFAAADYKPPYPDGRFRVVIVSTGSVASVKIPDIVGALSRDPSIDVQVVATKSSLHFYNQDQIDKAVTQACQGTGSNRKVPVWRDEDEWSDWHKIGDPILHIELRRWADLVVVAPCSADFLAKLVAGFSDNLPLSMMRALTPSTPVILCPAMNTQMYQHPLTDEHLQAIQKKLRYLISGPQGAGTLACGDEGPGKMTDWRDIVSMIQNFGAMYLQNNPPNAPQATSANANDVTQYSKQSMEVTHNTSQTAPSSTSSSSGTYQQPGDTDFHPDTGGIFYDSTGRPISIPGIGTTFNGSGSGPIHISSGAAQREGPRSVDISELDKKNWAGMNPQQQWKQMTSAYGGGESSFPDV